MTASCSEAATTAKTKENAQGELTIKTAAIIPTNQYIMLIFYLNLTISLPGRKTNVLSSLQLTKRMTQEEIIGTVYQRSNYSTQKNQ